MFHMNKKQEANAVVIECITTALLNMMKKQSFESISITALTKRAGVGRVSFYRNFESKEDVIRKHLRNLLEDWWAEYKGTTTVELVQAIFEHYYKNKELSILLYKQGLAHISLQSVKDSCGAKPEQDNNTAYFSAFCVSWDIRNACMRIILFDRDSLNGFALSFSCEMTAS